MNKYVVICVIISVLFISGCFVCSPESPPDKCCLNNLDNDGTVCIDIPTAIPTSQPLPTQPVRQSPPTLTPTPDIFYSPIATPIPTPAGILDPFWWMK